MTPDPFSGPNGVIMPLFPHTITSTKAAPSKIKRQSHKPSSDDVGWRKHQCMQH